MSTEQEILKEIRKIIPNSNKYLFDDCAVVEKNLVVTSDTIVQGVHFDLKNYLPNEIGWKAMAVNLSDIASMGAKPLYAMVSLSLPKNINLNFVKELYKGIQSCAKKYKTQIIGGNLTSGKELSITIALIGKTLVRAGFKPVQTAYRKNARPGDLVFCTGTFGDAAGAYHVIASPHASPKGNLAQQFCKALVAKQDCFVVNTPRNDKSLLKILKTPTPQINLGQKIITSCSRVSMMDASDGLADCLLQISKQSKVKIIIDENKIPISNELINVCKSLKKNPIDLALYGGEDYQLVGTISKKDYKKIKNLKNIRIIGEVYKNNSVYLKQNNNKLVKLSMKRTYAHFK